MLKWIRMCIIQIMLGVALGVILSLFYFQRGLIEGLVFGTIGGLFIFAPLVELLRIWITNFYNDLWRNGIGPRAFRRLRTPSYHEERGDFYHSRGNFDRAIAEFNISFALSQGRRSALFFYKRGRSYYAKGERDLAIADFDAAIRRVSDFTLAHQDRAKALAAGGGKGE